jgi:hypothetical protein
MSNSFLKKQTSLVTEIGDDDSSVSTKVVANNKQHWWHDLAMVLKKGALTEA